MTIHACPSCQYSRSWTLRRKKRKCKRCRKESSPRPAKVASFRATEEGWRSVIKVFLRERSILRVASEASFSKDTAAKMAHLLRQRMAEDVPETFVGRVEMDETYIGGQRKNKKLHIRRIKAKSGHGTDKLPIVGLFSRETGQVVVHVEPSKLDIAFIRTTIR